MATIIVVFKIRYPRTVEDIIERNLQKKFPSFDLYVAHGDTGSPSFVASREPHINEPWRQRIAATAAALRQYAAPDPKEPSREALEFTEVDNACKWGVATTQERARRDHLASRGIGRARRKN